MNWDREQFFFAIEGCVSYLTLSIQSNIILCSSGHIKIYISIPWKVKFVYKNYSFLAVKGISVYM